MHGFINVWKEQGPTSADVVRRLKRLLFPRFGRFKIGHVGTLDPLAEGLLPVACGEATKAIPYMADSGKAYVFDIKFGERTNTDDAAGEIVSTTDIIPSKADILGIIPKFLGDIMQVPPQFSAVKVNGLRAYDLARKGQAVDLKPRPNHIYRLELLDSPGLKTWRFEVEADRGFYVRSLVRDMARCLGSLGYASLIRRTRSGAFAPDTAISLDKLEQILSTDGQVDARHFILDISLALDGISARELDGSEVERLVHGQILGTGLGDGLYRITFQNELKLIASAEKGLLKPVKVFNL
jgi:tRNA pseudouridine55 synthase